MKKTSLVFIFVLLLLVGVLGCQGNAEPFERVTIYDLTNMPDKIVIEDNETITMVQQAIDSAIKVAGIVNMADPEYKVELGEQIYYLWLDEKSGTIMNKEDTHIIYSLKNNSIKQMNELIQEFENE